ncbi:LIC_10190 family membrane protein [Kaistella palustris]|uniref:LIC_10190 family membrane protein n=1 Tax=Kaistella palustris TaxID=493376 RepID=UPI001F1867C6|nr:hypothetical protein [Kaistella palustris]
MVYILCMLVILLSVLAGFGRIFQHFFGEIFSGLAGLLLSGLVFVSVLFTLTAFIFPLNIFVEITTIAIGLFSFFFAKVYCRFWTFFHKISALFFAVLLITVFFGSYFPFILDHFGYYVPSVKWLAEVGLVRGISNLDLLLGQMSVWHIFQAGFSNFTDPFLRINTLILVVFLIYIFEKKRWIHLLAFPVLFLFSQSPSPDLAGLVLSLILLQEIFLRNHKMTLLFAFSVFVLLLKPTMMWMPLFALFYGLFITKAGFKFISGGLVLGAFFIVKNIWTFGFPIFPVAFVNLGFSWTPAQEILATSAKLALEKTYDLQFSYAQIRQFSLWEYIRNWLCLPGIKGVIHLGFIGVIAAFFIFCLKKNTRIVWFLFISVLVKSILILYFSAQYRFFIDVFFVSFFIFFNEIFSRKIIFGIFTGLSFLCFFILSFPYLLKNYVPSFNLGFYMTGFSVGQFYKPSVFELKNYQTHQIGNLKFNVVQGYPFSFDTPLPAVSPAYLQEDYNAGIVPQAEGKTLKRGFNHRKMTSAEKQNLKMILNSIERRNLQKSYRKN